MRRIADATPHFVKYLWLPRTPFWGSKLMTLLSNTITWGVPSTASINHSDMICFTLFRDCLLFQSSTKMERRQGEREREEEEGKRQRERGRDRQTDWLRTVFYSQELQCLVSTAARNGNVLSPSNWPNKWGPCVNAIPTKGHSFHIYNQAHNAMSQSHVLLCLRFKNQNTYCLKLDQRTEVVTDKTKVNT